jgi:hypothetical protein
MKKYKFIQTSFQMAAYYDLRSELKEKQINEDCNQSPLIKELIGLDGVFFSHDSKRNSNKILSIICLALCWNTWEKYLEHIVSKKTEVTTTEAFKINTKETYNYECIRYFIKATSECFMICFSFLDALYEILIDCDDVYHKVELLYVTLNQNMYYLFDKMVNTYENMAKTKYPKYRFYTEELKVLRKLADSDDLDKTPRKIKLNMMHPFTLLEYGGKETFFSNIPKSGLCNVMFCPTLCINHEIKLIILKFELVHFVLKKTNSKL